MEHVDKPSEVEDTDFVCMPPVEEVAGSREDWERCGKWILSDAECDSDFVDLAWTELQPLIADGRLIMLKASTSLLKSESALIQCFAGPGKKEARRAAEAIRAAIDYRGIMYYKENKLTMANVGRRFGHRNISIYMHTYKGRFYSRDSINGWIRDTDDSEPIEVPVSSKFRKINYRGSEHLPSRSPNRFMNFPPGRLRSTESVGNWFLKCRCSDTDDGMLAEADRVWIVAKQLVVDGAFRKISCRKSETVIEIRMYVPERNDVLFGLEFCDQIFEEASVRSIMFFNKGNRAETGYTYKYTPEGELYEKTSYSEKFVLQREGT